MLLLAMAPSLALAESAPEGIEMFSNEQIWDAIDSLASLNGLSTSRLSVESGMDATALNKSKRAGADGRPRWVSTETIAKILTATRTSPQDFFDLVCGARADHASHPARGTAKGKVLLVDSDQPFCHRMAAELESAGYDVEMAPDLRHALQVVESGLSLDLLITDLNLPYGAHGRTLARIALAYHPHLKVIFVTRVVSLPAVATGAEIILQKPLAAAHLGIVAAGLLNAPQAASATSTTQRSSIRLANGSGSGSD
jgi:CheY-like chemotaxis protein